MGISVTTRATLDQWNKIRAAAMTRTPTAEEGLQQISRAITATLNEGSPVFGGRPEDVAMFGAHAVAPNLTPDTVDFFRRSICWQKSTEKARTALELLAPPAQLDGFAASIALLDMQVLEDRITMCDILMTLVVMETAQNVGAVRDGTVLDATGDTPAPSWEPTPRKTAEYRRKLINYHQDRSTVLDIAAKLDVMSSSGMDAALDAAGELCRHEVSALQRSTLYYAGADTCAAAVRKALRGRTAPLSMRRVPTHDGLIVLQDAVDMGSGLYLAAASWSYNTLKLQKEQDRDQFSIQLYAPEANGLEWWGMGFPTPGEALTDEHTEPYRIIVALWDLITQERVGPRVVDTRTVERQKAKARSDARRGITDRGDVRVVTIRGRARTAPAPAREEDAGDAPRRRYDRGRWMVSEHERNQCMNPHRHKDGECEHEDITIMEYPKGPEGAPFLDTVNTLR